MTDDRLHLIKPKAPLPEVLNDPFFYAPHPLCLKAEEQIRAYIAAHPPLRQALQEGKMLGTLIVDDGHGVVGFLAAFSGQLDVQDTLSYFVPPIGHAQKPDFLIIGESHVAQLTTQIGMIESDPHIAKARKMLAVITERSENEIVAYRSRMQQEKKSRLEIREKKPDPETIRVLNHQSAYHKARLKEIKRRYQKACDKLRKVITLHQNEIKRLKRERKIYSESLQKRIFMGMDVLNSAGQTQCIHDIFMEQTGQLPPSGTGDCCAPKLLQHAFRWGYRPLAIAEFWIGQSPYQEVRHDGHHYPACSGKCKPLLKYMLHGIKTFRPMDCEMDNREKIEILFEDDFLLVAHKPHGILSIDGKEVTPTITTLIARDRQRDMTLMPAHRLDMDTSGALILAKDRETLKRLQSDFAQRLVKKSYVARLEHGIGSKPLKGVIDLPLTADLNDRPRQKVDMQEGKKAVTAYQVITQNPRKTLIRLIPITGRTHQLRVHCSSMWGLDAPIIGDRLYGKAADRLYLHAERITFRHPHTGQTIDVFCKAAFAD